MPSPAFELPSFQLRSLPGARHAENSELKNNNNKPLIHPRMSIKYQEAPSESEPVIMSTWQIFSDCENNYRWQITEVNRKDASNATPRPIPTPTATSRLPSMHDLLLQGSLFIFC